MADFSYQNLVGGLAPPPQSLWDGLSQPAPQAPPVNDPSMLAMMRAKQAAQQDPRVFMREINPGMTWGGRDRNAIQPNDVMQSYFMSPSPESI